MSVETLNSLRSQIKTLTEPELIELTRELVMRLDNFDAASVEQAWLNEIDSRVNKIESGEAKLLSRYEFETKMQAKLNSYQ
ncbi:addiction module protein [Marinospirillum insulare]|uniref:Addiction module component, TIGR02574 family n=1 Tax=Marinospirillum insulare TaxID=217169 RepID=A0ABQ5ZTE1_9GAMM|nr:addiction module protein [Marinospirillum insulare]GLR63411.1 hypothetical protein GCM10007878_08460 [Marinospirillum insulare]